jgi:hypothetical protein
MGLGDPEHATGRDGASDLIFEALCLRYRSTTSAARTMTRQELQDATGLRPEALVDALRTLAARTNQDLPIHFVDGDPEQVMIGPAWASRCEDMAERRTG